MRETLIKLDYVNNELKKALFVTEDNMHNIDKKWLHVFDTILKDMIETRSVIQFATGKCGGTDWELVNDVVKKT